MFKKTRDTIKNYSLLALCFCYALVRGSAKKLGTEVNNILIVHDAKMGDMVCLTPTIRAAKQARPQARVFVYGNAIGRAILAGNQAVGGYIESNQNMFALIKSFRQNNIDYVAIAAPDFRAAAIAFLAGIKTICCSNVEGGFSPWETAAYGLLKKLTFQYPLRMNFYAPAEYLGALAPLGSTTNAAGITSAASFTDTRKELYYSPQAAERIKQFFAEHHLTPKKDFIVAISPSAGNKIKNWPGERFAEVAAYAHKKHNAKIIIIGSRVDGPEVEGMLRHMAPGVPLINTLNLFSIDELKAFLSQVSLLVAVDTGPIYIAEAFGVPTIDIIGPVSEKEQPPISAIHKIVFLRDRKAPAVHIMNARIYDSAEARRQVEGITVAMVEEVLEEVVGK